MNMKFCPNYGCVAYGRVVYTQSTRCVFCRWDLKPPRMKSETAEDQGPVLAKNGEGWAPAPAEVADVPQGHAHRRRGPAVRHTA
jgi:hypothetical protein